MLLMLRRFRREFEEIIFNMSEQEEEWDET
jgi:hypothetical protein